MNRLRTCLHKWIKAHLALMIAITLSIACTSALMASSPPQTQPAGNVYYVALSGDDSNPGTQSRPWRTIQKAAKTMVAGDSTTVLAGDYSERVQVTTSGAPGASISYRAEPTVTMKGFTVNADYINISGFDISDTPDDWTDGWGIFVEGSYCVVEGNYVHFATRGGITLQDGSGNESLPSHCIVKNNRLYRNSQVGIWVSGRDNLIEGNEIWRTIQYHPAWVNPPNWVDADGMRFFGAGHVIRDNYIHDISFNDPENVNPHIDCFQTWGPAHDIVFEQNRCEGLTVNADGHGVQGWQIEELNPPVRNLTIRNNILRVFRMVNATDSAGIAIANNTFVSDLSFTRSYPSGVDLTRSPSATIKNNIFYNVGNGRQAYLSLADEASKSGLDVGYNSVYMSGRRNPAGFPYPHDLWQVDPMLVNPSGGDFHLQPNSPAIDAGQSLASVVEDFDGNPRPEGAGYDIGAYEFAVSSKVVTPATAQMNEIITFTITVSGNGKPMTVTDPLPSQLTYLTSTLTCLGTVIYNAATQQVQYSGTPPAGLACVIGIPVQVNTNQRLSVVNSATIDKGQPPLQNVSATVILNGFAVYLPIILKLE